MNLRRTVLTALTITLLTACARSPEPVAPTRMSVQSDAIPERRSQSDLPRVQSLEDLQAVKPSRLDENWDVRLGLSDGGALASGWHVLYCLLSYRGEGEAPWPEYSAGRDSLGPLELRIDGPAGTSRANILHS